MTLIKSASRTIARNGKNQDRIKITSHGPNSISVVLADSAREVSGGERAAEISVETLARNQPNDHGALFDSIMDLDYQLKVDVQAGLTTVVCIYTTGTDFIGAVIGDSDALLVSDGKISNLAPNKELLPLLGDGEAFPTVFSGNLTNAVLVVCSDGLSKYISATDVVDICRQVAEPVSMIDELINVVELPDGEQQDDISVVVLSGK